MTKGKNGYQWFVKPRNGITNEAIAAELAASGQSFDAELRQRNGQRFYRVEWSFIKALYELRNESMAFSIHNRVGRDGELRNVTDVVQQMFHPKPSAPLRKASADLAKLRRRKKVV